MNFDGFTRYEVTRFSSQVEQDDPTNLPVGVSPLAQDVTFHLTGARTRDGIQNQYGFTLPDGGAVTGLGALKVGGPAGDLQVPVAFSALGNLYKEFPVGSGKVVPLNGPLVTLPAGSSQQIAAAFAKGYFAFTDLKNSKAAPAVYNPALGTLDPLSMLPFGAPWGAGTPYHLGECVTPAIPVNGNGRTYRCVQAGVSGVVQPAQFGLSGGNVPNPASAGANSGTPIGATAWVNPGNVNQEDGVSFAVCTLLPTTLPELVEFSQLLQATGFGFAVPVGATIVGVIVSLTVGVEINPASGTVLVFPDINASLFLAGQTTPAKQITPSENGPASATLGTASDKWGAGLAGSTLPALTPAIVNNAGFGVTLGFSTLFQANAGSVVMSIQNVQMQVVYTTVVGNIADGTVQWQDQTPMMSSSPLGGNVAYGLRYMIVLFMNRNGYLSGWSPGSVISNTIADSLHQLQVSFPTGPSNTIARILAFTTAGQLGQLEGTGVSSAGPYFWIDPNFPNSSFDPNQVNPLAAIPPGVTVADVINGITMNSTLINDNITTQATLNFTDDYLKQTLNDVSSFFRKIQIPGCSDVYFSQTLQRMFYAADILPSGWYVSLAGDPESVFGDTGMFQAAENNGENRTAVRDFAGVCYAMKEKSGYVVTPTAGDPSTWDAIPQWTGSGPCGPRAVDVATNFMCYVHRSGIYVFESGQPYRISKELPITWSNINWACQQTIWVMIDDETREIRVGVPYGQSTVPNKVLKLNYEELPAWSPPSFAPPIHFSPYVGKEIAAGGCYKWSVDNIAANVCIRAERVLPVPPVGWPLGFDLKTTQSQILYGSANADGHVDPIIPGTLDDNGTGIDSIYETCCPSADPRTGQTLFSPHRLGGVQANIDGEGQGSVYVLALRAKDPKSGEPQKAGKAKADRGGEIKLKKPWIAGIPYSCGGTMTNERMRLRFTNDKRPGCGFDLKYAAIYATPVSTARPR